MEMRTRNRPKHYNAGSERVATRIGGGGLYAAGVDPELSDRAGKVFCQSLDQVNSRRLKENKPDCIANGLCTHGELLCDIKDIPSRLQADTAIDYTDFRRMIHNMCAIHHDEPDVYFYHSDHPGSASWITDNGGVAVQHLQYLPYGERYVDQRVTSYQERFTFTGKERDEETGYGYFGARYMDHELTTMWLSVDPMSDKYPGISPYAYCAWSPVKLVDPDGMEMDEPQRRAAIAKAQEYEMENRVDKSKPSGKGNSKNTYKLGAKGQPGEQVDCSGMTSESIKAGGEPDPTLIGTGGGVQRTVANTNQVVTNDMEPGNVAVFNNQGHIGLITEVYRDESGNVTGFKMIHSSGDPERGYSGPNCQTVTIGGNQYWDKRFDGVYKWDSKPDALAPQPIPTPTPNITLPAYTPIIDNTRVSVPAIPHTF